MLVKDYDRGAILKRKRYESIACFWVFHGTASAPFVPAQGLRAHGNSLSPHPRPLSTAFLAQTIGKLPKHHASASAKSWDVNSTSVPDTCGTSVPEPPSRKTRQACCGGGNPANPGQHTLRQKGSWSGFFAVRG